MISVGDRATFTLYTDVIGAVTVTGLASNSYQWIIKADDGRIFVANEDELELL
jgi:hypothetical protein